MKNVNLCAGETGFVEKIMVPGDVLRSWVSRIPGAMVLNVQDRRIIV